MKKICILFVIISIFSLSSCSGDHAPEKLTGAIESNETIEYTQNNDKAIEVMETLIESENRFSVGSNMFGSQDSFVIKNSLYIFTSYQGRMGLFEVNPTTGKLEPICRDPLCQHTSEECLMTEFYQAVATDGESIFALHGDYISKIDPEEGKLIPMCRWKNSSGAMCCCITCNEGYIYFAACTSDTTNEIYRMPVSGGKPEQLSTLGEHIEVFTVSNGHILFRNSVMTLKCAPVDFSKIVTIAEKTTTMTSENGRFFYYDSDDRINEVDISTQNTKVVAENASHYRAFLSDGNLYYHKKDFQKTKQLFCYHADTGETTSIILGSDIIQFKTGLFSFDSDSVIFHNDVDDLRVYGAYGDYLLVFMYDEPMDKNSYELNRFFFLKKDGTEMAEIFIEDFQGYA